MSLLIVYVLVALGFSFLCSIAESVILSVTPAYVALLQRQKPRAGKILFTLKANISHPLAAILTLNTIAHTVGAAGAGAQATVVFGSAYLGIASAIMTLLILVFSEIIPKTLGAHYWRQLAPATGYLLRWLVWFLYPFVKLSEWITGGMTDGPTLSGFSRQEFAAMAELSANEGQLGQQESEVLKNLLALRHTPLQRALTPRTVMFSLPANTSVKSFYEHHQHTGFSRIPIFDGERDNLVGFVLRSELLLEQARGNVENTLGDYRRDMPVLLETISLTRALQLMQSEHAHMALVVDEYGDTKGILTLEDILETLLGLEIVDESDKTVDMQQEARQKWHKRAKSIGLTLEKDPEQD